MRGFSSATEGNREEMRCGRQRARWESIVAHRVCEETRMSNCSMHCANGSTYLLEPDGGGLLAEALTAEVKAVLADETSLVRAVTATHIAFSQQPHFSSLRMKAITNHWREPLPYLRGRENQTASWVILKGERLKTEASNCLAQTLFGVNIT